MAEMQRHEISLQCHGTDLLDLSFISRSVAAPAECAIAFTLCLGIGKAAKACGASDPERCAHAGAGCQIGASKPRSAGAATRGDPSAASKQFLRPAWTRSRGPEPGRAARRALADGISNPAKTWQASRAPL